MSRVRITVEVDGVNEATDHPSGLTPYAEDHVRDTLGWLGEVATVEVVDQDAVGGVVFVALLDTSGVARGGLELVAVSVTEDGARQAVAAAYLAHHVARLGDEATAREWIWLDFLDQINGGDSADEDMPEWDLEILAKGVDQWYGIRTVTATLGEGVIV